ncbi:A-kinase anchor protein 12 isoform X3 [Pogona vitticeps]
MGAGSSAEQRSPQDGATVAGESQPGSPEGQTPTEAAAAPTAALPEEPEEPGKLLQKNGQISSLNGIAEEQVALSLKPEELNGQQPEGAVTDVGQRETATAILKDESVENMEIKASESSDKTIVDGEQKDTQGVDKLSPSLEDKVEEQEQPSESLSNDVGFKKVFKLVGFKFTVRKDKTEKVEPVQLLNIKADEAEVASSGAGDCKEVNTETVDEATQSEVPHLVEKTEEETQTDQKKDESLPKQITESPLEAESKQEVKTDVSKSPESPTSPVTTETASPLRKLFAQGWAGFRKRTSFRKLKEEQQAIEKEKQEQEKEVITEETTVGEELEKDKPIAEKDQTEISMEVSGAKAEKEREEREETKMVDVSTGTHEEDVVIPHEQLSTKESVECEIKESEISLKEEIHMTAEEGSTQTEECLMTLEQGTLASSEKKLEPTTLLTGEASEQTIDQSDLTSPMAIEKVEEPFEIVEADKSEPEAPVMTEIIDEKSTEMSTDSSTTEKREETQTTPKEELVLEQLVETGAEIQSGQPSDEQLTVKETSPEVVSEHLKQTEPSTVNEATSKPPEGITNEVELLSSQERAKIQGSPLKKLFTSSSLKKLSGKKRKGKKEEAKSGEAGEQMQQFSDSAESPEDPRGESSASSPEEATESVEKADASQIMETEEGSTVDVEKKRESVTPWASFKKMVTPKKRVRRLSESDKEDELDKAKNATLSSTESGPGEEQEDSKENGEEQKLEKSTEEPKRKVDTSVSWEALICVGSSKKRSRKSSSSDEEVGQRLAQEGQKIDERVPTKEAATEVNLTSSQESDQGQGNSSPEQVGSPSEGEGVSTWESFKRLVTPRRKSKTKMEDRSEETATVPSLEHSTSDTDSGKEESWVSFKKLMPGRRKKKSDGVPEHAPVQETGEEMAETNEEDYDVPAVVPLSEYEAAEQEKSEAQMVKQDDMTEKSLDEKKPEGAVDEQSNEGLIHAVTVTVVEGERAVTSIEERSPSWISAAVTESIEHANEDEEHISETGIVEETVVDTKLMPEIKKDISGDTIVSELTSEAITAREEPSAVEEGTEVSCAEETTEMVSAVSRLSESPDTTEIATPVQEAEEGQENLEKLNKQTQEILQEVAERVKVADEVSVISESMSEVVIQPVEKPVVKVQGDEWSEKPLKEEDAEKADMQTDGGIKSGQGQVEVKESDLKEVLEQRKDMCMEVNGSAEVTSGLDRSDEGGHPKIDQDIVEEPEKILEKQMSDEKSEDEEEFVIVTVTPEEEQKVTIGDTNEKQLVLLKEMDSGDHGPADTEQAVKVNVEGATSVVILEDVPKADELMKVTCEEKPQLSQKQEEFVSIILDLKPEPTEQSTIEVKLLVQNEVQDAKILVESPQKEEFVLEAPILSKIIEVPVKDDEIKVQDLDVTGDTVLGTKTESAEEVAVETSIQSKDADGCVENLEMETQKMEPESWLQKSETKIPVKDMKSESLLVKLEEQIHAENMEKEVPIKLGMGVHTQNVKAEDHIQKMETNGHQEEVERKSDVQSMEGVLAVKPGVKDVETKTECVMEKPDVKEHIKVAEVHVSGEEVHTVSAVDMEEVIKTKAGVEPEALPEKVEVEPPVKGLTEEADVTADVESATEKAGAKVEAESSTEKEASKTDVEASTKEADTKVEDMILAETATSSSQAGGKLEKDVIAAVVDMESHVETAGAEVAEKKSEMEVPPVNTDVEHSTKEVKVESSEKSEVEILTKKAEAEVPIEKVEVKPCVEVIAEEVDAEVDVKDPAKKMDGKDPAKQSEVLVEADVAAEQLEKENLQKMQKEIVFQSDAECSTTCLTTCVETVSAEASVDIDSEQESVRNAITRVPVQTELPGDAVCLESKGFDTAVIEMLSESEGKDGTPALEVSAIQIVTEEPKERGLGEQSTSKEDTVDLTQAVVGDARLILKSQIPERIKADTPESKEEVSVKDVMLVESKSAKESLIQKEISVPCIKTEEETLTSIGSTASEGHMQREKEDAFSLEYTKAAEDTVQSGATGDTTKEEFGEVPLATELDSTEPVMLEAVVEESILLSDSGYLDSMVSNTILESKRDSTPLGSSEASRTGITVKATAAEEQIIAENVTLAEPSTETLQSLPEEQQETEFKLVQQVSFTHSEYGAVSPATEIVSEKFDSTVQEPISPTVNSTKDDLLQKCVLHSIPETKHQKPETSQEAEKKTTPPERSPSLTHIEFQKDGVQSVTIESQSTTIVLKIIQNAVDKLEETEEPVSLPKQQSESHSPSVETSETQTDLWTGQQPAVIGKEEKIQEIQVLSITQPSEKQHAFKTVEEMPLHSEKSEDGKSVGSSKISAEPEAVKHTSHVDEQPCTGTTLEQHPGFLKEVMQEIIKEKGLQKENGDPKDTAVSTETQRATLEGTVSGDVPKESLELGQPKLKDIEVGQTVQIQEQFSEQQTHVKRKDHSPSTEFVEGDVNNQDCTSCKSPPLKSELAES